MIFRKLKLFVPVMLGALLGFLYYNFIGCNGSCAITSGPVKSTLYGAFVGLILTDWKQIKLLFTKREKEV
jgi:UDP-N-acetylmuramyl pentapeptide phosphotransferase/UDP-N-acetylglucosamine-1-phosphate transferase